MQNPQDQTEGPWHAEDCPLHEISPHDCAYDVTACTCSYRSPPNEEDGSPPSPTAHNLLALQH